MRVTARRAAPPRPHLPPLLLVGLALWAGVALVYPHLREAGRETCAVVALAGATIGLGLAGACVRRRRVPVGAMLPIGLAAALVASGIAGMRVASAESLIGREADWECTLTTDARSSPYGATAQARAQSDYGAVAVRLNLPAEGCSLMQGERIMVSAPLAAPAAGSAEYFWNAGLGGSLTLRSMLAERGRADVPLLLGLRRRAVELLGAFAGAQAPLLQALVCGWRGPLEETGAYEQFKRVGLAHVVAVSGAHLSIVTLFVAGSLRLARVGRRATAVFMALFLAGYVCFTGMPVSALRAATMAATGLLALTAARRASALAALGLCLVCFGVADAPAMLSASFALSAGSTLGIVLLSPLFQSAADGIPRWLREGVAGPLALTAASAAATQPYAAALFAQVPLLAPVANVVGTPLFALACVIGFATTLVACLVPALAPLVLAAAAAAAAPLQGVVACLAACPAPCAAADVAVGPAVCLSALLVFGLWAWWPALSWRSAGAFCAVSLAVAAGGIFAPPAIADEIVMLDVGQGDAFLVRSQGATLLIDTGNRDTLLKEACARQGVRRIDGVLISHPDDDHCGSLDALADIASVSGLLVASDLTTCACDACARLRALSQRESYGDMRGLAVGDTVRCGRFTLTVVWPASFADAGGNADSLSLVCGYDGDGDGAADWTALFCGDAEAEQLRAMGDLLPEDGVDVLKVGHHGSKKSLDAALIDRLDPSVALISVGADNRYGHPSTEVCSALEDAGARVLRTDLEGDVAVAFSMEKLSVRTQRDLAAA